MNVIILRINEAGLFNHWNDETIQMMKIKRRFLTENEDQDIVDANYSLTFLDLKTIFIGTFFYLLVCCLVFIGELIVYKYTRHAKMKKFTHSDDYALFDYVN